MDIIKFTISFIGGILLGIFITSFFRDVLPNNGIAPLIIAIIIFGSSIVFVYYLIEKLFPSYEKKEIKIDITSTNNQVKVSSSKITEDLALKILAGRKVVAEAGVFEEPITIGTVSLGKKNPITGEVDEFFYWNDENGNPDTTRQYAIVNLQAMSIEQSDKANELFEQGDWEDAISSNAELGVGNLSMRMNIEDVEKNNIARGSIVKATFDYRLNRENEEVLVCTAISPMVSKAGNNSFRERLAQQKAVAKANQIIKDVDTE